MSDLTVFRETALIACRAAALGGLVMRRAKMAAEGGGPTRGGPT